MSTADNTTSIAVYVCTHRRNGPLRRMLDSLAAAAARVQPGTPIGVVVVDDNPDGRAKEVVDTYEQTAAFDLGLHYQFSGAQNISLARNTGLEAAFELAEWVAMTDDDQTVSEQWFEAMLATQRQTGADCVTGPVLLAYPEGAPPWLTDEPFDDILVADPAPEGSKVGLASTGNSMLRTSFLRDHPDIRFLPDLGTVGGEDMVFYSTAVAAGLDARFSVDAVAYAEQPPERTTYRATLRSCYWMGNTEYVTSLTNGEATRPWLALRGIKRLVLAGARPLRLAVARQDTQWHYCGACMARALGMLVGVIGIRVAHK